MSLINQPIVITPKSQPDCTSIIITNVSMPLNDTATIYLNLLDSNGELIKFTNVVLEGQDYNNWTSDESLVALILSKLQMSQA